MHYTTNTYITRDKEVIFYYKWAAKTPLKGIVQISHGIGEHAGRYHSIAKLLQEQGYEVYANDHRVHGKSVKSKKFMGIYKGANYFDDAVKDMRELTLLIKKAQPNYKVILFGHSMGSLLSRKYVTKYGDDLTALILSGTASFKKGLGTIGLFSANIIRVFKGRSKKNKFIKSISFAEFNKNFKPNRTELDWISTDEKQVDIFKNDPYRIIDFSLSIFIDLIKGSKEINTQEAFNATPKSLPIYIFSGDKDPVGDMGKGVKKVVKQYYKAGIKDLTFKLYKGGRHEMLNETNKTEVERDLITWLNSRISNSN
ncbi:MAG: lysophospholipase [Flavobacteriaceae bacterium]|nr:lysophospholipase [Flavobacteriaceae bacterium]